MPPKSNSLGPTGLVIEAARESDLAAVLALYAQPEMDNGRVLTVDAAREVLARMRRICGYELYVARRGDAVVGTFALLIMPNLGHCGSPSGVLEDVVVATSLHGRGIGRAMVYHAIQLCTAHGCYKLTLSSNLKRSHAHAFYERLDFERHGYSFRTDVPQRDADPEHEIDIPPD